MNLKYMNLLQCSLTKLSLKQDSQIGVEEDRNEQLGIIVPGVLVAVMRIDHLK